MLLPLKVAPTHGCLQVAPRSPPLKVDPRLPPLKVAPRFSRPTQGCPQVAPTQSCPEVAPTQGCPKFAPTSLLEVMELIKQLKKSSFSPCGIRVGTNWVQHEGTTLSGGIDPLALESEVNCI